jgi:ribosomal protein S14
MSAESLEKRRRTKSSQEYKSRDSAIRASKEYKDKFSKMIGRRMTDDRLRKHIEMMKTEEYREKVSSALKGKKKSAQSIEKMILTKKARKAERSGPNAYNAAFDKEEVKQIRDRASSGESNASIARDFGVSRNCIRGVVTFKTYSSF